MDKEWHRPKKPYVVNNTQQPNTYSNDRPRNDKPKAKPVIIPAKNNENNKLLHQYKVAGSIVKIHINNKLCSDDELLATYEGKIKNFDDFTIHMICPNGEFLINKSSVCVIEFMKDAANS